MRADTPPRRARAVAAALSTLSMLCALPVAAQAPARGASVDASVPTPASVIGFVPGTDRKLPQWSQVVAYFQRLDAASPRVQLHVLGRTTLGRPFIAAIISDSATIAHLDQYRAMQARLADPRLLTGDSAQRARERDSLIARVPNVVLVTSSIHSTEVGGILTPMDLAYRLASGEDPETRAIRANTIVLLVPSLNPDGVDIVGDWYRSTLGTPAEGTPPPVIYHYYTGHDNNRDWYAFTQVETQLTVDSLHNVWHPEITNDIHQQGADGSRLFIPPYMDPWEPNVDPILITGVNALGTAVTWRLTSEGKVGIANNTSYDAWTPARQYMHYHAGARILTETASARLASPITVDFDSLRRGFNDDPRVESWNFAAIWPGGRWTIGDIVDYQTSATWALLSQAAANREQWVRSFATLGERAVAGRATPGRHDWPVVYVIPMQQPDQAALRSLLRILQRGQVEIRRAEAPFASGNVRHSAGTYVIPMTQPYASFAKALLERQHYPDLREYPGGPPKRPYDVTAQTLPLLMGVGVAAIPDSFPVPLSAPIAPVPAPTLTVPGLSGKSTRRIAIYRNFAPSMDEGWTRWVFDQYHIPFTSITDHDVARGGLAHRFDVIILPDQRPAQIENGARYAGYPDSLKGGLGAAGDPGAAALRQFVDDGGTLITFNDASEYAIRALALPVTNVLQGVSSRDFYCPGSILQVELLRSSPLVKDVYTTSPMVWFEEGPAFDVTDSTRATVIARYPAQGDPLLSGWLLGGARLNGKAALVDVRAGKGHVVLFGFRPQYRGQSMATYPLIWDAILAR